MWYRVIRNPQEFRRLTSCQRDPGFGALQYRFVKVSQIFFANCNFEMLDNILFVTTDCKLVMTLSFTWGHILFSVFFGLSPIASKKFLILKMAALFIFHSLKNALIEFFYFKIYHHISLNFTMNNNL